MANEPELKHLHRHIELEESETALYRERLGARLKKSEISHHSRFRPLWIGLPLAAAAALVFFVSHPRLSQLRLDELRLALEANAEQVLDQAKALEGGDGLQAWNANMVQCLSLPPEQAVFYAARGLGMDSRAEFRFFYLEYLLDYADERIYNIARLGNLIDRETDPDCLKLFRWMLRIS